MFGVLLLVLWFAFVSVYLVQQQRTGDLGGWDR